MGVVYQKAPRPGTATIAGIVTGVAGCTVLAAAVWKSSASAAASAAGAKAAADGPADPLLPEA